LLELERTLKFAMSCNVTCLPIQMNSYLLLVSYYYMVVLVDELNRKHEHFSYT